MKEEIGRANDADDFPFFDDREVMDIFLNHQSQRRKSRCVRIDCLKRSRHHMDNRSFKRHVGRQNATAKIAVGDDARRLSGDQNRADPRALHLASGFGNGYIRCNEHRPDLNQVLNRLGQTIVRLCSVIGHKRRLQIHLRAPVYGSVCAFCNSRFPSGRLSA